MYMEVETKICAKCGGEKPLDDFWAHPTGKYGRRPRCKECVRKENHERYLERLAENPDYYKVKSRTWASRCYESYRKWDLKKKFGISEEDYIRILTSQNGVCGLCGQPMDEGKKLAVDHDHNTGEIRGILHNRCNMAIGLLLESPEICRKAAVYLEKHGKV